MSRLVIGIGAEDRGDDAAGIEVARGLRNVDAVICLGGSLDVIHLWEGWSDVVIVDAMKSGAESGTVKRFDGLRDRLPTSSFVTTHALATGEAIELARVLERLPPKLTVFGIEADNVDLGAPMSPEVKEAVTRVVAEIDHA
ncbi:MAG: hydrogenase maturation protease [Acidimicrobiia bacterium]|jgi:hydrogenase maturation protease